MTTVTTTQPHSRQAAAPWRLTAIVRLEENGPEVTREAVTDADLADARSEAWLHGVLRKGHPGVALGDIETQLVPIFKKGAGGKLAGFGLDVSAPGGSAVQRTDFTIHALPQAPERAAHRLLGTGMLKNLENYYYEIIADKKPATVAAAAAGSESFTITTKNPPLAYMSLPLRPLLERARVHGSIDDRNPFVFYTADAFARTERFARKGGEKQPPVETGAVLVGPLCSCPDTGEFFAVVVDALEVLDAEQTKFSLSYTGKSWARIQSVMRARQANPSTRAHRILGQAHGHNFLPADGAPPCEMCAKVEVCTRTSVFLSSDDREWSRAVFSQQPWQLCHIFGLNARAQHVHGFYGLRDGRLMERGYHVVPEFPAG